MLVVCGMWFLLMVAATAVRSAAVRAAAVVRVAAGVVVGGHSGLYFSRWCWSSDEQIQESLR